MRIEHVETDVLRIDKTLDLPEYATSLSAGMDLRASFHSYINGKHLPIKVKNPQTSYEVPEDATEFTLMPGERALIPTGCIMAVPAGYEMQVRPRSGLAWKHGITVINSPGTIDADYRDSIGVLLINNGFEPFKITHGDRIAQGVFAKAIQSDLHEVQSKDELDSTDRGGGIGHTGVK